MTAGRGRRGKNIGIPPSPRPLDEVRREICWVQGQKQKSAQSPKNSIFNIITTGTKLKRIWPAMPQISIN